MKTIFNNQSIDVVSIDMLFFSQLTWFPLFLLIFLLDPQALIVDIQELVARTVCWLILRARSRRSAYTIYIMYNCNRNLVKNSCISIEIHNRCSATLLFIEWESWNWCIHNENVRAFLFFNFVYKSSSFSTIPRFSSFLFNKITVV